MIGEASSHSSLQARQPSSKFITNKFITNKVTKAMRDKVTVLVAKYHRRLIMVSMPLLPVLVV